MFLIIKTKLNYILNVGISFS